MADQKITELPIKNVSAIQLADYLLGIDSAEGYQMLISDLAKKIIEAYSGSSLGGAAQTLKSAIDTVTTNAGNNLATIEHSTTASKAYAVGDYLVLNGILYKVTTAIASGGTITVDTNVTAAAAGDDIAAITTKIGNTSMGTTANTITGAIAEHESDISGLNSNLNDRVGTMVSIDRARIASSSGNATKAYARASAVGAAYGTALVSNNSRLWFVMFNPSGPTITNIVGTGGTITYDSSTLTFTITSPTTGQMTVWAGGGIGSSGTITFGS